MVQKRHLCGALRQVADAPFDLQPFCFACPFRGDERACHRQVAACFWPDAI